MYNLSRFYQKFYLLLNTLETLNIYKYKTINQKINSLEISNFRKNEKNLLNYAQDHQNIIRIIYDAYKIINEQYLQEIIVSILTSYTHNNKSIITLQYLKRYQYIYKKNYAYFSINNHYHDLNIYEIAITNLYILSRANQQKGLFILIYYLYK